MEKVRLTLLLLLPTFLSVTPLLACEGDVPCSQCARESEFSWNPANQFVTPKLSRFYSLEHLIRAAYEERNEKELRALTDEYLALASTYRCNWNYGNAIHDANRYLGLVSLREGKVDEAAAFLVRSGKSKGSPTLNNFGPDLDLANELLKLGRTDPVKEYLAGIKTFWKGSADQVDEWLSAIDRGEKPELDRTSAKRDPWLVALGFLMMAWPTITTLSFLYLGRRRLSRKMMFLFSGLGAGYVTFVLISLSLQALMIAIVTSFDSSGPLALFSIVYVPLILVVAVPTFIVFLVYRYFSSRNLETPPG